MDFNREAHKVLREIVGVGDVVVDATMGNGFDTLFLSNLVGEDGQVFAFDVQELALESTREYLERNAKFKGNVELILRSHEFICEEIAVKLKKPIRAATFNLGYLPRADKLVRTSAHSSLKAMRDCLELADKEGFCLSVLCYVGHESGSEEYLAVVDFFKENFLEYNSFRDENNAKSPILLMGEAKNMKKNV